MTTDPRDRWPATPEGDLARVRAWNRGDPDAIAAAALDSADRAKLPTATDDLIAFLRARLDEDEQAAMAATRAANTDTWIDGAEGSVLGVGGNMHIRGAVLSIDDIGPHIARWDPARVLAEVKAKRRILDEVVDQIDGMDDQINGEWGVGPIAPDKYASVPLLKLLALPHAEHPDYRDEWRPTPAS